MKNFIKIGINKIYKMFNIINIKLYRLFLKSKLKKVGQGFLPRYGLVISGGKSIVIGKNFKTMGIAYIYSESGELIIGDNVSINTNVIIYSSSGKINIGSNVLIGPNTVIRAADHGSEKSQLMRLQPHRGGTINIGNDVWIGANSVVLKNTELGEGCIISAGSVVNKSVEPYSIVSGVPAKRIGKRQ